MKDIRVNERKITMNGECQIRELLWNLFPNPIELFDKTGGGKLSRVMSLSFDSQEFGHYLKLAQKTHIIFKK